MRLVTTLNKFWSSWSFAVNKVPHSKRKMNKHLKARSLLCKPRHIVPIKWLTFLCGDVFWEFSLVSLLREWPGDNVLRRFPCCLGVRSAKGTLRGIVSLFLIHYRFIMIVEMSAARNRILVERNALCSINIQHVRKIGSLSLYKPC